ncbi:sodium:solute symporter [Mangrovimonas xylaniphaga]|uniref:sodium:solute symporter n=1 Tax=Mangrovimonas xylaniphaga TaxID=1645915 RepID=UPI0006B48F99|nr:sodium:solute symporter [Mangrovimonas xylaniphaga]
MGVLNWLDWAVLVTTLLTIVGYGTWKTRGSKNVQDFVKGGNSAPWWTVGLSVMATQASAITFLSTPGQAFHDGMGFVQFYFGVPIAIIVICMVFIPLYDKLKVYTAYEFLENRFDRKTRTLTSSLFLIQRGLSAGITIYAPAIILSAILHWNLTYLNIIIGTLVIIYTVSGGTKAVSITQKHQMGVIFLGMFIAFCLIISYLPENITFTKALDIAGASGKMNILNFDFDFENRYTLWSGLIGGSVLALSYFGTDQSQVQRYLSGKSVKEMQMGLIFNGLLKVPMQFSILLVGVMVFVFYQFHNSPINFNPAAQNTVSNSAYANDYQRLEEDQLDIFNAKQSVLENYVATGNDTYSEELQKLNLKDRENRDAAKVLIQKAAEDNDISIETNDKDYVFIHFILNNLPRGLIGLLLAVILSAAMSSTAGELNALASTTALDIYKRNFANDKDETHYLKATKWFTLGWGILAILIACVAYLADNLIQLVNIIGSIFYGNVLGIFLLAFFFKYVKGHAVFIAALITQGIVIIGWWYEWMPYLWLNLFGCILVILIAFFIQNTRNINESVR